MNVDIIIVLIVILGALVLFFTEKLPVELTAMVVMGSLIVSGVLTPSEGIAGFSNTATITVGAMFVLSAGLFQTGALNFVGSFLVKLSNINYWLFLVSLMLMAGGMSAFINDTAVVALLMPIVIKVAKKTKVSPSRLLMPLSFSALFGGVCTLIGTSTNILVSAIAEERGLPAFTMFEFAPFGLVVLCVGIVYMLIASKSFLPDRGMSANLTEEFGMGEYLTEIILLPDSKSIGKTIKDSPLVKEVDIDIIEIIRENGTKIYASPQMILRTGDTLRIRGNPEKINELKERVGIQLKSKKKPANAEVPDDKSILFEAIISPNSSLLNKTLKENNFRNRFQATVLAIKHREELVQEQLGRLKLMAGDALLIEASPEIIGQMKKNPDFVIVSEVGLPDYRKNKILTATLIVLGVIACAATGLTPILTSAIIGCILLIITGCITLEESYRAVEWKVIFLLAGVLSMGIALEKSGGAKLIADLMISTIGTYGPQALVSAFFLITLIFTNFMSNNATAALLAPIAIFTAMSMQVDPKPFLMAVVFAASLSFITPVGYQTNTMIYGPGNYKFTDFTKVGTPLDILLWILASLLIPFFYPF